MRTRQHSDNNFAPLARHDNLMQSLERIATRSISESSDTWPLGDAHDIEEPSKDSIPPHPSAVFAGALDWNYNITEISDNALEFIGASRDELIGRPFPETPWWKSSEDRRRLGEALARARNGKPDSFESFHEGASGEGLRALFTTMPVHGQGHFAIAIVGVDITAKRAREDAEIKSEKSLRLFFENNSSVMMLIEPNSGRIVDANCSACAYYGYAREVLSSLKISDINTMPEKQLARERMLAATQKRNYFIFSHRLACGAIRQVEVHTSPVEHGAQNLLLTIVHDISDRIDAQGATAGLLAQIHEVDFAIGDRIRMAMADSARAHAFNAVLTFDFETENLSEKDLLLFEEKIKARLSPLDTIVRGKSPRLTAILCKLSSDRRHAEQKAALHAEMALAESGIASAKAGIAIFSNQGNPFEAAKSALENAKSGFSAVAIAI